MARTRKAKPLTRGAAVLSRLLQSRGWTIDDVAKVTGVHRTTVWRWLTTTASPSLAAADRMRDLGVPLRSWSEAA